MKPVKKDASHSCVFAIELHSSQSQLTVQFYEQMLSVKFKATAYPFPRYIAEFGRFALIISDSKGHDVSTRSTPGKVTLGFLFREHLINDEPLYYLHSRRPIGGLFPTRYAQRVEDPDGNYLAMAPSMENMYGRVPTISTFRGLIECMREYGTTVFERVRNRLRFLIDHAIDLFEYSTNRVTFLGKNLVGYTHVVASREGVFVVNSASFKRVLRGAFFGATLKNNCLYCFQSCGRIGRTDGKGRILRFTLSNNRIKNVEVIIKGLDDGCHQIDFIGEDLLVVDCYNGRILQIKPGAQEYIAHYPLGQLSRKVAQDQYHMNSLAGHPDGSLWVLLHNNLKRPSEVIVLNPQFEILRRFVVDAGAAHNIVFTDDGSQDLIADSIRGRLISHEGCVIDGDMMMTRGVSLDEDTCVVGDSFFSTRPFRRYVPGVVHFFDRASWVRQSSVSIPAAPTEIRRIDGKDFSISNFFSAQVRQQKV